MKELIKDCIRDAKRNKAWFCFWVFITAAGGALGAYLGVELADWSGCSFGWAMIIMAVIEVSVGFVAARLIPWKEATDTENE